MSLPTQPEEIWEHIRAWPFAVLGFVTVDNEARAAGVMYVVDNKKLYVLTGPDTWKVRHLRANPNVSVTVTVQRIPIRIRQVPPAVITFAGKAEVKATDDIGEQVRRRLLRGYDEDIGPTCVIEIEPVGRFVTYGIGVPAPMMRRPDKALARVPVGEDTLSGRPR